MDPRAEIRSRIRAQRRALSPQARRQLSERIAVQLARTPLFLRSRKVAVFFPNDGEVDLHPLIERGRDMGKHIYLPVLSPAFHNRLWFSPYHPETPLLPNQFGIPEPCAPRQPRVPVWSLDLVLTPLVAFDPHGNRLGMGGGFYDRTLAYLRNRSSWHKPHLIGVAFEFQRYPQLPAEVWDVPLHGAVTEQGYFRF